MLQKKLQMKVKRVVNVDMVCIVHCTYCRGISLVIAKRVTRDDFNMEFCEPHLSGVHVYEHCHLVTCDMFYITFHRES